MRFTAAVVQLTTTTDIENSLEMAEQLIDAAAQKGAHLVVLPENVHFMGTEAERRSLAESVDGPHFQRLADKAAEHQIWLVAGSMPERQERNETSTTADETTSRPFNTSVVFNPKGHRVAQYRKIHLFDVELGEQATHQESKTTTAGDETVLVKTPLGNIGLSICYDLRFPDLYRNLRRAGAQIFTVPAAFTVPTGRDHWEVLLRARAIENQCYVLAAAQQGQNSPKRATFGRSMIVDPWGTVLATAPDRPAIAIAEIDLEHLENLRRKMPCLNHEKPALFAKSVRILG